MLFVRDLFLMIRQLMWHHLRALFSVLRRVDNSSEAARVSAVCRKITLSSQVFYLTKQPFSGDSSPLSSNLFVQNLRAINHHCFLREMNDVVVGCKLPCVTYWQTHLQSLWGKHCHTAKCTVTANGVINSQAMETRKIIDADKKIGTGRDMRERAADLFLAYL